MKVLIIEDVEILAKLWKEMIRFFNPSINVDIALTGKEAVQKLKNNHYDIVFLDIILPDISGFEILEFLNHNYKSTKIIIITASSDTSTLCKINNYNYDKILIKPVSRDAFLNVLKKFIS